MDSTECWKRVKQIAASERVTKIKDFWHVLGNTVEKMGCEQIHLIGAESDKPPPDASPEVQRVHDIVLQAKITAQCPNPDALACPWCHADLHYALVNGGNARILEPSANHKRSRAHDGDIRGLCS